MIVMTVQFFSFARIGRRPVDAPCVPPHVCCRARCAKHHHDDQEPSLHPDTYSPLFLLEGIQFRVFERDVIDVAIHTDDRRTQLADPRFATERIVSGGSFMLLNLA